MDAQLIGAGKKTFFPFAFAYANSATLSHPLPVVSEYGEIQGEGTSHLADHSFGWVTTRQVVLLPFDRPILNHPCGCLQFLLKCSAKLK
jgi:hypothetical protein